MNKTIALRLVLVFVACFVAAFLAARYYFSLRAQLESQATGETVTLAAQAYMGDDTGEPVPAIGDVAQLSAGMLWNVEGPILDRVQADLIVSCYEQSDGLVFDKAVEGKERLHAYFDTRTNILRLVVMYDGAVRGELIRVKLNDRTVEGSRVAGWKVGGR